MFGRGRSGGGPGIPDEIEIIWTGGDGRPVTRRFARTVRIGRDPENDVCLPHAGVSRRHAEVVPAGGGWTVRDLGSSNGTFLDGRRIGEAALPDRARIQLGGQGPVLSVCRTAPGGVRATAGDDATRLPDAREGRSGWFGSGGRGGGRCDEEEPEPEPLPQPGRSAHYRRSAAGPAAPSGPGEEQAAGTREPDAEPMSREEIRDHYFSDTGDDEVGEHTRAVRFVWREQHRRQRRRWLLALGGVGGLLLAAVGGLFYQARQEDQSRRLAIDLFYDIKTLEVELGRLEAAVRATGEEQLIAQLRRNRAQMRQMRARYDSFIQDAGLIDPDLDDEDALILRIARIFGECELEMPPSFLREVKTYIRKWQATDRLERALRALEERGHLDVVARALIDQGLPPHFLYLGLQESNFNIRAIGPETRFGIAKGAWQFIPATGQEYGLRIGPLKDQRVFDPHDDRFDFLAATRAAARFLRDIYNTDAQASGLLVMASYNWGPHRIIQRIRTMPENPRERNFWALLQKYEIPEETYHYVFYIISAAVIGENPRLFGFDFDNPLRTYAPDWSSWFDADGKVPSVS